MKPDNPFDKRLEDLKRMPLGLRDASIDVTDTLDLCWVAAQAVFEKAAKPEHALQLLPVFMAQAEAERRRLETESQARNQGAP
jgi:hypothetical protein